jgi:hypothetical protein
LRRDLVNFVLVEREQEFPFYIVRVDPYVIIPVRPGVFVDKAEGVTQLVYVDLRLEDKTSLETGLDRSPHLKPQ